MPIFKIQQSSISFPSPHLAESDGLLGIGGDLSCDRLIAAYRSGIFPWYDENSPILWWSPDPRCILFPQDFHIPKSLQKSIKKQKFTFRMDTAFADVIYGCAGRRGTDHETWIVPEIIEAYCALHQQGYAHSIETWANGELVGGLYGVSLGSAFFGESMFFKKTDASKAALVILIEAARLWNFSFIDCQQETSHLARFGAASVPRSQFLSLLQLALKTKTRHGKWTCPF